MKKLQRLSLFEVEIMSYPEMKHILGGSSSTPSKSLCDKKKCKKNGDCNVNEACTSWSHCPNDSTYGRKRCY